MSELLVQASAATGVFPLLVFPGTCMGQLGRDLPVDYHWFGSCLSRNLFIFLPLSKAFFFLSFSLLPSLFLQATRR